VSAIYGVWNLDGAPVDREVLDAMGAAVAHRGPDGEGRHLRGALGLGCRLSRVFPESAEEEQPLIGRSGVALVFDGRLDNREELIAALGDRFPVSGASPDPDVVVAAHEAFGESFVERLRGDFALGLFDPRQDRLLLARDPIGVRPLYWCRAGASLLFGSEVKALLAHPAVVARANDEVLAEVLLNGAQQAGDETCFQGVYSVQPSHSRVFERGRTWARKYWDFDVGRRVRHPRFEDYLEEFRHLFAQAVHRRLRSTAPVAVSLSGGLDSSSIFCQARSLLGDGGNGCPDVFGISYVSADNAPSDEREFLADIERQYEVVVEKLPIQPGGPLAGSREAVWHIEVPFLDSLWSTTDRLHERARERGARVLLSGHWGDEVLCTQAYLVDLARRFAWLRVRRHLGEYRRWYEDIDPFSYRRRLIIDVFKYHAPVSFISWLRRQRSWRRRSWYGEPFSRLARERSEPPGLPAHYRARAHARAVYEQIRSPRHVLCMEWNSKVTAMHGLEMAFPFLDRDLLEFLMAIPGEVQTFEGVPKALLRRGLAGVLPETIAQRRWKADLSHIVNEGMSSDYARLASFVRDECVSADLGYVDAGVLDEELKRWERGRLGPDCEASWRLSALLGLELWLQVFCHHQRARRPSKDRSAVLARGIA
jgi:asparagine synthase (glutamine-hydrolysing)